MRRVAYLRTPEIEPRAAVVLDDVSKLLVVVALLSGCSVALMDKPRTAGARCAQGRTWPVVDAAIAAANLAALVVASEKGADLSNAVKFPIVFGAVGWGFVSMVSSANGFGWAGECRRPTSIVTR